MWMLDFFSFAGHFIDEWEMGFMSWNIQPQVKDLQVFLDSACDSLLLSYALKYLNKDYRTDLNYCQNM
jgi:hypothetical protein